MQPSFKHRNEKTTEPDVYLFIYFLESNFF